MKIQFRYRFEAAHRFVNADSPNCQTPHGHTWHVTLVLQASEPRLTQDANMVVEFQTLKSQWKKFVQEHLDHSFFFHHQDPVVESFRQHIPGFRGFPVWGDPTTEMLSVLFLKKAQTIFSERQDIQVDELLLEETPVNSIRLSVEDTLYQNTLQALPGSGWWDDQEISSRNLSQ